MKLYHYWRSTTSYRVRAALNLKQVDVTLVPVDLVAGDQRSEAYLNLNPGAGVPSLILDDGTILTQSLAILEYIDTAWPEGPKLLPDDALARARVNAVAQAIALDIHPVNNTRVIGQLKERFEASAEDCQAWMQYWMADGFRAVETMISCGGKFAYGDQVSIADLCIVAQVYNAHRWGLDLAPYPNIRRIESNCLALPEIQAAHPDNQVEVKEL